MITISATFEFMIFGVLGPHGTFWFYGGVTLVGFIWCLIVLKETRGLTNLQKKTLYMPTNKAAPVSN